MQTQKDFDQIFTQYYKPLFIFAKRFFSDDDECHDMVGDAFEDLWTHFPSVRQEAVKQYLYTCLRRKCIDRLRKSKSEKRYVEMQMILTESFENPSLNIENQERQLFVAQTLESLGSPTKEILTLCYLERHKYSEVAEIMGISVSTVKKHIVKALKIIRERRNKAP